MEGKTNIYYYILVSNRAINSVQGAGQIIPTEVDIDTLYFERDITFDYIVCQNRHSVHRISKKLRYAFFGG